MAEAIPIPPVPPAVKATLFFKSIVLFFVNVVS
ncbi:MAG: hypothetical protein ACI8RY_000548 [Urechidicola sp.]|jgi:hypothetical protein